MNFAVKHANKRTASHLGLLVQLKMLQRLGRFVKFSEIPKEVISKIRNTARSKVTNKQIQKYFASGAKDRHVKLLKSYVGIKTYDYQSTSDLVKTWALETGNKPDTQHIANHSQNQSTISDKLKGISQWLGIKSALRIIEYIKHYIVQ